MRGREPDRRHGRRRAALRRLVRGARHGGRVPRRRLPGDADGRRARRRAASPGRRIVLYAHLDTVPIPHEPAADRGRPRLRPRLGRHEGRGGLGARGGAGALRVRAVQGRAGAGADRPARGAGRARRGPHAPAQRDRLHRRLRRRLRDVGPRLLRRAHGPGDRGDHDHAAGHADARAADAARHAASAASPRRRSSRRCTAGARSWPRSSTRGSAPRRTSSARCTAATSTTAGRRSAASSARAAGRPATRSRRSTRSTARCSTRSPPRRAARSTSTCASSAARTRSTSTTSSRARSARRTPRSRARSSSRSARRSSPTRAVFAAAGIPTVYHGPVGSGAHADVEYIEVAGARARERGLPRDAAEAALSDAGAGCRRAAFARAVPEPARDRRSSGGRHAAARGRGGGARGGAAGVRADARRAGAARGDRGAARRRARLAGRPGRRTCWSRSAACRALYLAAQCFGARAVAHAPAFFFPQVVAATGGACAVTGGVDGAARLGRVRGGDRPPRRRSRSSTRR